VFEKPKALTSRNSIGSQLPDGRIFGHVDLPDLFLGQADGFRDGCVIAHSHLHKSDRGRGLVSQVANAISRVSPLSTPPVGLGMAFVISLSEALHAWCL
jgi:hypothetical protein